MSFYTYALSTFFLQVDKSHSAPAIDLTGWDFFLWYCVRAKLSYKWGAIDVEISSGQNSNCLSYWTNFIQIISYGFQIKVRFIDKVKLDLFIQFMILMKMCKK